MPKIERYKRLCTNCYKTFDKKKRYDNHVSGCGLYPLKFKCTKCDRRFHTLKGMHKHLVSAHNARV